MKTRIISVLEASKLKDEGAALVYILPKEYFDAGHIEGSINISVYDDDFASKIKEAFKNKADHIVLYGKNKNYTASDLAYEKMYDLGYENVYNFREGFEAWKEQVGEFIEASRPPEETVPMGNYDIDLEKSFIEWVGGNFLIEHFGNIDIDAGAVTVGFGDVVAGCHFVINMQSIRINDLSGFNSLIDTFLVWYIKSKYFLDVSKLQTAEMRFIKIDRSANANMPQTYVHAELTLKDITNLVEFPAHIVTIESGAVVIQAEFDIDIDLWKIRYGSDMFFSLLGQLLVYNVFTINIKIVTKKP
ncbi:MAG: rhodanese-like domain-containing protein [bacterium]